MTIIQKPVVARIDLGKNLISFDVSSLQEWLETKGFKEICVPLEDSRMLAEAFERATTPPDKDKLYAAIDTLGRFLSEHVGCTQFVGDSGPTNHPDKVLVIVYRKSNGSTITDISAVSLDDFFDDVWGDTDLIQLLMGQDILRLIELTNFGTGFFHSGVPQRIYNINIKAMDHAITTAKP